MRNVSIVLTVIQAVALMLTPGGAWSGDPKDAGFWLAIWCAVCGTVAVNLVFVKFSEKS